MISVTFPIICLRHFFPLLHIPCFHHTYFPVSLYFSPHSEAPLFLIYGISVCYKCLAMHVSLKNIQCCFEHVCACFNFTYMLLHYKSFFIHKLFLLKNMLLKIRSYYGVLPAICFWRLQSIPWMHVPYFIFPLP